MREIKFRGIATIAAPGQWMKCPEDVSIAKFFEMVELAAIDPATVGQWTGIQDCNGKDIYEGDIVDHPESEGERSEYIVVWDDVGFTLEIGGDGYYFGDVDAKTTIEWEVIGNIHEVKNDQS